MKAKDIALGGIMIAITSIVLYLTSFLPTSTLTVLTVASAIIPVVIIRSDIKTAIFVYLASSMISFFLVPINISIMYGLFFGFYGIVKYFAEKNKNILVEFIIKLVYFNVVLLSGYYIFVNLLGIDLLNGITNIINRYINISSRNIAFIIFILIGQIVFLAFDYGLTLIITFYLEKVHSKKM